MPNIDVFLNFMLEQKASDVHLSSGAPAVYRIDGEIIFTESEPLTSDYIEALANEIMPQRNIDQFAECNDTDLAYSLPNGDRFRVNVFRDLNGVGIVARVIPANILTFEQLNLPPVIADLCTLNKGLVLVTGPTGSGKSTTLAAMVDYINRIRTDHIITIEDPVEYRLPHLTQIQVNPKIGLTFANGLRHIVRQDPDIVLVGEIRDGETADIAINAALTGHLVLSTLHTNDAVGAIGRLLDMGVESFLLSSVLYGVLSQRLVRRKCAQCGGTGRINDNICGSCGGWGYSGRTGLFELLRVNDDIRSAINRSASSSELERLAIANGMKTLLEDGLEKVKLGITAEDEVRRVAMEM